MEITEAELERRMQFARQEAAGAWTKETTSSTPMDCTLAEEFAKILVVHMYEPHMGCARTSELQAEIDSRAGREEATIEHD